MQKENENLQFFQGLNFNNLDSIKTNVTKYWLFYDDWYEERCNSKAFIDIATGGRHRGLSNFYIKHNMFDQSKLGRDVELQNMHIVFYQVFPWCDAS